MTPQEIQAAIRELEADIGRHAYVSISVSKTDAPLYGSIWPNGLIKESIGHVRADDWPGLFDDLRTLWADHAHEHGIRTVKTMALAIIGNTADFGACTDAALRGNGFDQADIDRFGPDACAEADAMAGNGPFEISAVAGANAA